MPEMKRHKTSYPGVYYIDGTNPATGRPEHIFYIRYRRDGHLIEEKVGRQIVNAMTPAKAAQIRQEKMTGRIEPNRQRRERKRSAWTLDDLFDEYLNNRPNMKTSANDIIFYRRHLSPALGHKPPGDITARDVSQLRSQLERHNYSPQTVKHVLGQLKRVINFGADENISPPLAFKIRMPEVHNSRTETLTAEQLARLIEVLDSDYNRDAADLMRLALMTGMRKTEILNLEWRDIDFERGFITIREPKGGRDQVIPMNDSARSVLEQRKELVSNTYVFPGENGRRYRTSFDKPLRRIRKAAGIPDDFRPMHGLRHVFASVLASSGEVDMYTLQKLLTHKTPQMTQRYAHLHDDALKRASGVMDRELKKENT